MVKACNWASSGYNHRGYIVFLVDMDATLRPSGKWNLLFSCDVFFYLKPLFLAVNRVHDKNFMFYNFKLVIVFNWSKYGLNYQSYLVTLGYQDASHQRSKKWNYVVRAIACFIYNTRGGLNLAGIWFFKLMINKWFLRGTMRYLALIIEVI